MKSIWNVYKTQCWKVERILSTDVKTLKVTGLYFFRTGFVFVPTVPITRRSYGTFWIALCCNIHTYFSKTYLCVVPFFSIFKANGPFSYNCYVESEANIDRWWQNLIYFFAEDWFSLGFESTGYLPRNISEFIITGCQTEMERTTSNYKTPQSVGAFQHEEVPAVTLSATE